MAPLILVSVLSPFHHHLSLSSLFHHGPTISSDGGSHSHSSDSLGYRSHLFQSTIFDAQIFKRTVSSFPPPPFLFTLSNATRFQAYTLAYHSRMRRGPSARSLLVPVSLRILIIVQCKRLKLRCDRRNPCGSCVKRDTVQRCQYTAAAAEKMSVHYFLHSFSAHFDPRSQRRPVTAQSTPNSRVSACSDFRRRASCSNHNYQYLLGQLPIPP